MNFSSYVDRVCGEHFNVWNGQTIGKCFKQICLIIPSYLIFLILSSYYVGYRNSIQLRRSKYELVILYIRIFICHLIALVSIFQLSLIFYDGHLSVTTLDVIQYATIMISWFAHGIFVWSLTKGVTVLISGPLCVIISSVICFVISLYNLYLQYSTLNSKHLKNLEITFVALQVVYLSSLLLQNDNQIHTYRGSVNSVQDEQEPLINSASSRYYGFHEEIDPQALGTAEESNNFLSKLLFLWVHPLINKGYKENLQNIDDLYDLPLTLQSEYIYGKVTTTIRNHNLGSDCDEFYKVNSLHLIKLLHTFFGYEFYSIGILKFISDSLSFGGPLLLNALVSFLETDNKTSEKGYYYVFGLFSVTVFAALCSVQYNYLINRISLKIRSAIIMIVYQKSLLLSKVTLSSMNTGEILNFISTDTDRIVNFCQSFHQFWSLPIQVIIAFVLLYYQVNFCFIVGMVFMLIIIPINQYIAKKIAYYSNFMMKAKDKRIKLMNEILCGIRTIKMNTWESIFYAKLKAARHEEVKFLKKRKYLDALCVYFWATTPVVMSFLTFTVYTSLGHTLTASKVFTSIALFNILITPLNAFPWVLNGLMEAWISVKRVNTFLGLPNLDLSKYYSETTGDDIKLEIVDGTFAYSKIERRNLTSDDITEHHYNFGPVNLSLVENNLVCVIGKVGSGKSTLLSSILADVNCVSGQVNMKLSERNKGIGYVSQESWIQQKSVKDNILFGKPLNILRYRNVLEACALLDDLQALPYGDKTEVGDKGVTLSGGQKARISLARAVYQDFDIYLLDDPFSSVDVHVAEHIFSNCIMGMLKNKSCILCTHKTQFAEKADHLIILSNGKVVSQGSPNKILQMYFLNTKEDDQEDKVNSETSKIADEYDDDDTVAEEEKEKGVVKFHVYKSYWKAIGTPLSLSVLLFCLLMQTSRTTSDWWLSYWVSSIHSTGNNTLSRQVLDASGMQKNSLTFYLSVYGGLAAANSIFTLFRAFLFAKAGIQAAVYLHDRLVKNVLKATTDFFDVTPLGRIINRFSSDIYCIDDSLPFVLNILLAQVFALVGCVIITCYGLPWIILLILFLTVIYYRIQRSYRYTSRELKRLSSISLSPIYAHFSETLSGHSTIRAFSASSRFQKENMDRIDANLRAALSTSAASQWLNLRLQFIGVIVITSVAAIALIQKEFGEVDAGLVGLALSYALSITSLLNGSITAFTETEKEIVSVERVMQYIETIQTESTDYFQMPPFAWPAHGVITFVNVNLCYRNSNPYSLKNISFETRPCEKLGIVGRTGSGKSSLIQVLSRMVNFEGAVFIDGVNIVNLELKKLRSNLSLISQDPFLFCGSIRENLDPNYLRSDTEIWKALLHCHMEEKIRSIGGLDAEIEERGHNFSSGERQLLCLARALLQRTKILCMDEATACIDYQTDSLIRHTVRMAFRHSTILIIAHRIETVMDCDRVLVMKDGSISEIDKPSALLSNPNSEFYRLVYGKTD